MAWKRQSLTLNSLNPLAHQQSKGAQPTDTFAQSTFTSQYETDNLDTLTSLHKRVVQVTNWSQLLELSTPPKPAPKNKHALKARKRLHRYRPSCLDRWFRLVEKKKRQLQQRLANAEQRDKQAYQIKLCAWQRICQPLWQRQDFAKKMIEGDLKTKINVLHAALAALPYADYCTNWSLTSDQKGNHQLAVQIKGLAVIPKKKGLPKTDSQFLVRALTRKERYHLYRQHVVSLALGLANEYFAKLPDHQFHLIAFEEQLIGASGQRRLLEVLSLSLSRQQLTNLRLETIDLINVPAALGGRVISQTKLFTIK